MKEDDPMCDAIMELVEKPMQEMKKQALQEGLQKSVHQGHYTSLIELICKKLSLNKSLDQIADELETSVQQIEPIYNIAKEFAPDYPIEEIYRTFTEDKAS